MVITVHRNSVAHLALVEEDRSFVVNGLNVGKRLLFPFDRKVGGGRVT